MDMLFAGTFEQDVKMLEQNLKKLEIKPEQRKEFNKVMNDIYKILEQNGYEAGVKVVRRMFSE